jgi:hypothetical protein
MHHTRCVTILVALVCLFAATAPAQTTTVVTADMSTPVVGLATTETVQINVVNLAAASASGTAASCVGTVTFYNSSGSAAGGPTSFSIGTGQISSASLPFGKFSTGTARISVRGVVALTETLRSGVPCSLATNIETYDTTSGVTHLHVESGSPVVQQAGPATGPGGH